MYATTKTKTTKKQTIGCWFGDLAKNKKAKTCPINPKHKQKTLRKNQKN
jgi:hypothetical protein